ncbi:hypothetical protein OSJ57_20135 [Sphingomonas sp. HH69]
MMARKHWGGWTFDAEAGTATAGDLVVTVAAQGDGTFALRFSGAAALEDQIRIGRAVMQVFERASGVSIGRESA